MPTAHLADAMNSYYSQIETGHYATLGLLPRAQAEALTSALAFHPLVQFLGGQILDDPGTSSHHLVATQAPFSEVVFLLDHEGGSRAVFANLAAYLDAADRALREGHPLSNTYPAHAPCPDDQAAVSRCVVKALALELPDVVIALLPSLRLDDRALLEALAADEDFFIVEALALEIARRPDAELESIAQRCAVHEHPQASRAGKTALKRIKASRWQAADTNKG